MLKIAKSVKTLQARAVEALEAEAAKVSLGHINNVNVGLLDREWGEVSDDGLLLSGPDMLNGIADDLGGIAIKAAGDLALP